MSNTKDKLEVGDKIKRFEVLSTKEMDTVYVITSVTKTLAKTKSTMVFKRELITDNAYFPKNSTHKILAMVKKNTKETFSSTSYYLIED